MSRYFLLPLNMKPDYGFHMVDEWCFTNRAKIVNKEGEAVYFVDSWFVLSDKGEISIHGDFTDKQFAVISHIMGNTGGKLTPTYNGTAFYECPQMVYLLSRQKKNPKGFSIHVMNEEGSYKKG